VRTIAASQLSSARNRTERYGRQLSLFGAVCLFSAIVSAA
jgi:hypothetical protein